MQQTLAARVGGVCAECAPRRAACGRRAYSGYSSRQLELFASWHLLQHVHRHSVRQRGGKSGGRQLGVQRGRQRGRQARQDAAQGGCLMMMMMMID